VPLGCPIWCVKMHAWAQAHDCTYAAETEDDYCPVCTDSSLSTVANHSNPWLWLIALFGLGFVKPSTFMEAHETMNEYEPEHE
jgi:hypothetical protein